MHEPTQHRPVVVSAPPHLLANARIRSLTARPAGPYAVHRTPRSAVQPSPTHHR